MDNEEDALINSLLQSKTTTTTTNKCKICDSPASHTYIGVISCAACKMFFRRNAEKDLEQFKCIFNGNCDVNFNSRHVCSACRLAKCFASGMEVERIRCSMPAKKMIKTKHKTTTQSSLLITNILSDHSTLSSNQWNYISNIVQCFDTYGPLSVVQNFLSEQNALPAKLRYKTAGINEVFTSIYLKTEQMLIKNEDYRTLCSQDQSVLNYQTVRHVAGFTGIFVLHQTKLLDDTLFYKTNENLFGTNIMTALKCITNNLDDDIIFIKLIITILFFSPANYTVFTNNTVQNFINPQTILRIQNTYIELAWKYMTYKHSSQNTVLCFAELIRSLFHYYHVIVQADGIHACTDILHSVINQTEHIVIVSDN